MYVGTRTEYNTESSITSVALFSSLAAKPSPSVLNKAMRPGNNAKRICLLIKHKRWRWPPLSDIN